MTAGFKFEDFTAPLKKDSTKKPDDQLQSKLTEAFEHGYKAGWDDASRSVESENKRITADLARSLTKIGCDAEDIQADLLSGLEPVLNDIVAKILPTTAKGALGPRIIEILSPLIGAETNPNIQLVVHGGNKAEVETLLESAIEFPVQIKTEDTLGQGQVFVRVGGKEKSIDLDKVIEQIQAAFVGFFEGAAKEMKSEYVR